VSADRGPVVLSWSGGKDSALALWAMREELGEEPVALLTTVTEDDGRVGTHQVPVELVRAQAAAAGLPLVEVPIPPMPSNEVYEGRLARALTAASADPTARPSADPALAVPSLADVGTVAFADLFLADIRAYREERLGAIGRRAAFPLWGRDTAALARRFVDSGFGATLVCVDTEQLDGEFLGRRFDATLLADLPAGVDPCGENGEFHTFVDTAPVFTSRIANAPGPRRDEGRFVYADRRLVRP
jgi:uncharacterized protein (TIGR00290 family)